MTLIIARFFPQMMNTIHKTPMNQFLLKRYQSTKSQKNVGASISNLSWDFDQQDNPLGLNTSNILSEEQKIVLEPYNYHDRMRMNSVRKVLMEGYNYWFNVPDDTLNHIEQVMTMIYEMAYMLDDMDDNSEYRRGLPTCYKVFGVPRTQVSGRACFSIILKKLLRDFDNRKITEIYADYFIKYWTATYKEIDWRENSFCPTIDEYKQMCIDKTGTMIKFPMELMLPFSDFKTDLSNLGDLIALHHQLKNDCSVLTEEQMWDTKGFCDDISEGKFSLAVIHAIQQDTPEGRMVYHIVKQQTKDLSLLKLCYSLLEKGGSLEFSKKCMIAVEHELREEIERLGGNPILLKCLDTINSFKNEENITSNRSNRKWLKG